MSDGRSLQPGLVIGFTSLFIPEVWFLMRKSGNGTPERTIKAHRARLYYIVTAWNILGEIMSL
jgi:hypothetical protein